MLFENTDLVTQLRYIAAAFRIESPCYIMEFCDYGQCETTEFWGYGTPFFKVSSHPDSNLRDHITQGDAALYIEYNRCGGDFSMRSRRDGETNVYESTSVTLLWNGTVTARVGNKKLAQSMAEAFSCLGLLTSDVEEVLGVSVSAHERIELLQDFEERLSRFADM